MTDVTNPTRPHAPRSYAAVALCLLVAGLLIALDLGSKAWASEHLSRARFGSAGPTCHADATGYIASARVSMPPKVVVENFFELRYAENCGAAFGFLNSTNSPFKKVLFYGAALGAVAVLLYSFREGRGGKLFVLAVPTIIAGAIGNFTDRIRLGYVVDFFRFYYRAWEYPTFNVADIAISVGVAALMIDGIAEEVREYRARKKERTSGEVLVGAHRTDEPEDASGAGDSASAAADVNADALASTSTGTTDASPASDSSSSSEADATPEPAGS